MTRPVIPIKVVDTAAFSSIPVIPAATEQAVGPLADAYLRPLHDLRISVTDRCNFRCVYCMPKEVFDKNYVFLPQSALLSFEEIVRLATVFVAHGVEKIRLTGGEPLLRKHLERLIGMLSRLSTPSGKQLDLTLTTNGSLLAKKAKLLKSSGLKRVTVSLDSRDETTFRRMNDVDFPVTDVLNGIDAALAAGLGPVKVNMVVKRGLNDQEILPMARHFKNMPVILRFIEYMDVGASNGWQMNDVVPSEEVVQRIQAELPLLPIARSYPGETAGRWRYRDGGGEIGTISSVTQAFCGDCSRARLSTEGSLYTCLFATGGHDLRALLRQGHDDSAISSVIASLWRARSDRYSAVRTEQTAILPGNRKIEMSYIGG